MFKKFDEVVKLGVIFVLNMLMFDVDKIVVFMKCL